ncbi:MAG: hypothetical protein ACRDM7_10830 [Thermoleophilaceae bacterium]
MRFSVTIVALVSCLVLAIAGSALAQSPTEDAYDNVAAVEEITGDSGGGGGPAQTSGGGGGALPFTGVELGLIALVGVGLLGVGVAVRRAAGDNRLGT